MYLVCSNFFVHYFYFLTLGTVKGRVNQQQRYSVNSRPVNKVYDDGDDDDNGDAYDDDNSDDDDDDDDSPFLNACK